MCVSDPHTHTHTRSNQLYNSSVFAYNTRRQTHTQPGHSLCIVSSEPQWYNSVSWHKLFHVVCVFTLFCPDSRTSLGHSVSLNKRSLCQLNTESACWSFNNGAFVSADVSNQSSRVTQLFLAHPVSLSVSALVCSVHFSHCHLNATNLCHTQQRWSETKGVGSEAEWPSSVHDEEDSHCGLGGTTVGQRLHQKVHELMVCEHNTTTYTGKKNSGNAFTLLYLHYVLLVFFNQMHHKAQTMNKSF